MSRGLWNIQFTSHDDCGTNFLITSNYENPCLWVPFSFLKNLSALIFFDALLCCYVVSGTHARLQKKGGDLLVTDLGSTNGTFIDEKRLTPGVPSVIPSGRYVTFGPIFIPSSTITCIFRSLGSFKK